MQIPLDYYRILGVPVEADSEGIISAYRDRIQQLPRREYTGYAIASRKGLIEQAYQVLGNEASRQNYDSQMVEPESTLSQYSSTDSQLEADNQQTTDKNDDGLTSANSLGFIEIDTELFIGALIILLELGEYEIVLHLAQPYLDGKETLVSPENTTEDVSLAWQDLVLTVTLAHVELAREQWLQQEYELAGKSLTQAHSLLERENTLTVLKKEINTDLHKLRPYQIWQLLSSNQSEFQDRQKGISLLRNVIAQRGGIEGKKTDDSGMNLDSFLKFIQQIRVYLTCAEQQNIFEQEAQRPSPAASYLAAYALIARGFSESKPQLIVRAKNILISLTMHQDVYLEQSICALLLGQTTEAEFSLSQSQEKDALKYIEQISQDSPDLLPGLCLYAEKWLQTEVYPQFKDLSRESVSLKNYFDNPRVQSYLEQLSQPIVETDEEKLAQEINSTSSTSQFNQLKEKTAQQQPLFTEEDLVSDSVQVSASEINSHSVDSENLDLLINQEDFNSELEANEELVDFSAFMGADLDHSSTSSVNSANGHNSAVAVQNKPQQSTHTSPLERIKKSDRQVKPRQVKTQPSGVDKSITSENKGVSSFNFANDKDGERWIWFCFLGLLLLTGLVFFGYKLFARPKVSSLAIPLSEPLIILPEPREELVKPDTTTETSENENSINQQIALDVVRKWLSAKSAATGPEYNLDALNEVLTGSLLNRWRAEGYTLRNKNAHRRYEHTVAIESTETDPQNSNRGSAIARIKEKSQYYSNGALNSQLSYEEELLVKYGLVKKQDNWYIQDVELIESN